MPANKVHFTYIHDNKKDFYMIEQHEDILDRQQLADKLAKLYSNDLDIFPLGIDGKWGSGKTFFTNLLIENLEKDLNTKFICKYIDCFQNDHSDAAKLTILAQVINAIEPKEGKRKRELTSSVVRVLGTSAKIIANAASKTILKVDGTELQEALTEGLASTTSITIENIIDNHQKESKEIELFQKLIKKELEDKSKTLIIFLDELDRCRPSYALSVLESIKHMFSIDNLNFTIVGNFDQIESSIKKMYGEIDAKLYLDKFIKHRIEIPQSSGNKDSTTAYMRSLFENKIKTKIPKETIENTNPDLALYLSSLAGALKLSLRDAERLATNINLYITTTNENIFDDRISNLIRIACIIAFTIKEVSSKSDETILGDKVASTISRVNEHRLASHQSKVALKTTKDLIAIHRSQVQTVKRAYQEMSRKSGVSGIEMDVERNFHRFLEEKVEIKDIIRETLETMNIFGA